MEERSLMTNDVHKKTIINIMEAPKITEKKPKAQPVEEPVMEFKRIKQDRSLMENQVNETQKLNADVEAFKDLNREDPQQQENKAEEVKDMQEELERPIEKSTTKAIDTAHLHEEYPAPQNITKLNEEEKSNPPQEK